MPPYCCNVPIEYKNHPQTRGSLTALCLSCYLHKRQTDRKEYRYFSGKSTNHKLSSTSHTPISKLSKNEVSKHLSNVKKKCKQLERINTI